MIFFILKSILSEIRIATPASFWFPFAWNIFFCPFTLSLYVSLGLKWISCRQHIYGSCFHILSVSQYLLVGAFNPFTFKVIIDTYVPIGIFLIVLGLFSLVFTGYVSPFSVCCKVGLVVLNSLNFYLSINPLISLSILNKIFPGFRNHGCRFFSFSTLNISCHSFLDCRVSAERSTVNCMGFPLYVTYCFSLAAFNILSLCLVSVSLINLCLNVFLLGFNL